MPKGIKGFQSGNAWRFRLGNSFAKGGKRIGTGRPKYFTSEEEEFIRDYHPRFEVQWQIRAYISRWLYSSPEQVEQAMNDRDHRIILRIYRRWLGGKRLARAKRFYLNARQRGLVR